MTAEGTVAAADAFEVAGGSAVKTFPQALRVGSDYVVLWRQTEAGTTRIVGTRLLKNGVTLDVPPLTYSRIPSAGPLTSDLAYPPPLQAVVDDNTFMIVSTELVPGYSTGHLPPVRQSTRLEMRYAFGRSPDSARTPYCGG